MSEIIRELKQKNENGYISYPIGSDAQYIDTLSGLNLQYNLMLGGNKTITIKQHTKEETVSLENQDQYAGIDIGTKIPKHTGIKEDYFDLKKEQKINKYIVHHILFDKNEEGKYPSFLKKDNVIGYSRVFKQSMSFQNLKYYKFIIQNDDTISEEVHKQ